MSSSIECLLPAVFRQTWGQVWLADPLGDARQVGEPSSIHSGAALGRCSSFAIGPGKQLVANSSRKGLLAHTPMAPPSQQSQAKGCVEMCV